MKSVISASRRTDIPGLYAEWFINRIKTGYLYVQNPFSKKWIYVSFYARICYIKFVNPYKKVIKNLKNYTDHYLIDISSEKEREFAMRLANIAEGYKIKLYACYNDCLLFHHLHILLSMLHIEHIYKITP